MNKESVPKAPGTDWTLNEVSINRGTTLTAVEVCVLFNGDLASAQELLQTGNNECHGTPQDT